MAEAFESLEADPENVTAWRLFHQVATRFAADLHAAPIVLERLTADLDAEAFADLIQRFVILYDVLYPAPKAPNSD